MLGVPACSMIPRVDAGKLTFAVEGSSRSEMTASDPKRTRGVSVQFTFKLCQDWLSLSRGRLQISTNLCDLSLRDSSSRPDVADC